MKDLTKGKILKVILTFALPVFIGNLFNLAYNLADTRIIGSFLGSESLASVGSVSTLSDLIVGFVFGLANGFAVLTARFFGMKDEGKVRKSFALSLEFGILISLFIGAGSYFGLPYIFRWLNVLDSHAAEARAYIVIIIYGLVFSCIYNVLASSLRAIGDVCCRTWKGSCRSRPCYSYFTGFVSGFMLYICDDKISGFQIQTV